MTSPSRLPSKILYNQRFVAAVLAGFLCALVGLSALVGWAETWQAVQLVQWGAFGSLVGASVLNSVCRSGRWLLWSRALALPVPAARNVLYYVAGFAFAPTPAKAGTAIRAYFLKQNHRVPYRKTMPMVLVEQMSDLLAIGLILGLCAGQVLGGFLGVLCVLAGSFFAFLVLFWSPQFWVKGLFWVCGKRKKRLFAWVLRSLRVGRGLFKPAPLALGVALGMVGWGSVALAVWWLFVQHGVAVSWSEGVSAVLISTVVGVASFLPGGVGGTEALLFGFLSLWGTKASLALVLVAAMRLGTLWFGVFLGLCVLPWAIRFPAGLKSR